LNDCPESSFKLISVKTGGKGGILTENRDQKNGANLIVLDEAQRLLIVREKTRESKLMLPGGGIERGEVPTHAAQSETGEETGIITDESHFRLVGYFAQRPSGVVFLFETSRYSGEISIADDNPDTSEAKFMGLDDIIQRKEEFRLAYLRMILRYARCMQGLDQMPYQGRLSDTVEYFHGLSEGPIFASNYSRYLIRA